MFGRIAAGLVHDLSHPIQNIGNSCKLIVRDVRRPRIPRDVQAHDRPRDRRAQARARRPAQHRAADPARALPARHRPRGGGRRRVDAGARGDRRRSRCGPSSPRPGTFIEGDVFALGRVYRNLIINAIQATAPGGLVIVTTEPRARTVQIRVYDTGCGIPPERLRQSSTTSSPPSGAAWGSAWRSRRRSSSSWAADHGHQRGRQGHDVRDGVPGRAARHRARPAG